MKRSQSELVQGKTSLFGLPRRTIFFSIGREGRKPSILVVRITSEVLLLLRRAPIEGDEQTRGEERKEGRKEGRSDVELEKRCGTHNWRCHNESDQTPIKELVQKERWEAQGK